MRVLITGAAGFIGSHLTDRLLMQGAEVVGVDNLSTGSLDNLTAAMRCREFKLREGSVVAHVGRMKREKFDVVYHLAAHVGAKTVRDDPYGLLADHAQDALAVVRYAVKVGAVLITPSSSEVYGAKVELPYSEEDFVVIGPPSVSRWSYGISKLWVEQLVLSACRQCHLRAIVPRLFNVTGPRQRADTGMVLPTFAWRALSGLPIEVHGGGSQLRCFSHVADIITVLMKLPERTHAYGHVLNIGHGNSVTVREVASAVAVYCWDTFGTKTTFSDVPHSVVDATGKMLARVPDLRKLVKLTGVVVPNRWDELVRDVCDYWAAKLSVPRKGAA